MSRLTKAEKVELAKAQVNQAEIMVKSSREKLEEWIGVLELRQEYLEAVTKVSDLVIPEPFANPDAANPPKPAVIKEAFIEEINQTIDKTSLVIDLSGNGEMDKDPAFRDKEAL